MKLSFVLRAGILTGTLATIILGSARADAGDWFGRRRTAPVVAYRRVTAISPAPLGTFSPTPMLMIRGDGPTGSGFSPLGQSGDASMSMYGPLSPFRAIAAPVVTYTRGYDGSLVPTLGTSFSTPNSPTLSSVVYPTQSSNYFGPRVLKSPPWWANGTDWIDQN
jgi:hypothetical protein